MMPNPPAAEDPELEQPSDEFASALEAYDHDQPKPPTETVAAASALAVGTRVKGTVVSIGDEYLLMDYGGRSEAVAETRHFKNDDGTVKVGVGDVLDLYVVESTDRVVLAPRVRTDAQAGRKAVRDAFAAGIPVSGKVTGVNPGGLTVDLGGMRGFCPVSQIEAGFCSDPSVYVGRTLEFQITSIEEGRGSAVVSRRALLRKGDDEKAKERIASLEPGVELEGKVVRIEAFGAFVDLGGVDGLVHVSELRHERTNNPRDVVKEGETVKVKVLKIEPGKGGKPRIALSMRAAAPDPWVGIETRFSPGMRLTGTVARATDFGAFITVAPGIDGLVHVSEAAPHRIAHVKEVLANGQTVEVVVLQVDPVKKRLSLSVKRAMEPAPTDAAETSPGGPPSEAVRRGRPGPEREGSGGGPGRGERAPRRFGEQRGGREERGGGGSGRGERGGGGAGRGRDRGARGERTNLGEREEHADRGHSMREESSGMVRPADAARNQPAEPTTMALALRKAMEEAERKQREKS
jgi:small subunit ribosomal protein S1